MPKDPNTTVSLIQNEDPLKFMTEISEAVVSGGNRGEVPTVLFSHTAVPGGFSYAAVLIGPFWEGGENATVVNLADEGTDND